MLFSSVMFQSTSTSTPDITSSTGSTASCNLRLCCFLALPKPWPTTLASFHCVKAMASTTLPKGHTCNQPHRKDLPTPRTITAMPDSRHRQPLHHQNSGLQRDRKSVV